MKQTTCVQLKIQTSQLVIIMWKCVVTFGSGGRPIYFSSNKVENGVKLYLDYVTIETLSVKKVLILHKPSWFSVCNTEALATIFTVSFWVMIIPINNIT